LLHDSQSQIAGNRAFNLLRPTVAVQKLLLSGFEELAVTEATPVADGLVALVSSAQVTLVSPRPTAKQCHVTCGNCLFGGGWLEVHTRRIYCIRKFIKIYDNVTLPST
jgi:hypothetical protein